MQDFMTDQELIAKQAAIIQALTDDKFRLMEKINNQPDMTNLDNEIDRLRDERNSLSLDIISGNHIHENLREQIRECHKEIGYLNDLVRKYSNKLDKIKKRPKFIMIINRRKRKNV